MTREAIEAAVDERVREVAVDHRVGVPDSAGGFEIAAYRSHLIGPRADRRGARRPGSAPPTRPGPPPHRRGDQADDRPDARGGATPSLRRCSPLVLLSPNFDLPGVGEPAMGVELYNAGGGVAKNVAVLLVAEDALAAAYAGAAEDPTSD